MTKNNDSDLLAIILSAVPYMLYVLVLIPLFGWISFNAYSEFAVTSVKMTNTIVTLTIILTNILVLLSVLYIFNLMTKFNMKKYLFVGGIIFIFTLIMAVYRFAIYNPVKIVNVETATEEAFMKLNDFKLAKSIFIAYAVYFILTILINKIAVISIKNKKSKSSR